MPKNENDHTRWSHRPAESDMPVRFELKRVGAKPLAPVICLSGDILGLYTHFHNGRTQPCQDDNCPGCQANQSPRWHGYLFVLAPKIRTIGILELTPAAVPNLDKFFREHRTLKGAELRCERIPKRANGRLFIAISESSYESKDLPTPPSLKKTLLNIFGMRTLPDAKTHGAEVVTQPLKTFTGTDS